MYQKKDGDGSLFNNGYKQKDSHPDMRGDLLLDGKEWEIAGWKKSTRNGEPWYSLKVQPKRAKPEAGKAATAQDYAKAKGGDFNDDIPFN